MPIDKRRRMMMMERQQNPLSLLNLPGGNFEGIDSVSRTGFSMPTMSVSSGTIIYRHARQALAGEYPSIFEIRSTAGSRIWIYINPLSDLINIRIGSGANGRTASKILVQGSSYNISWTADHNDATLGGVVLINGIPQTLNAPAADVTTGAVFILGSISRNGAGKLSLASVTADGIQQPVFCPPKLGVYGTANAGNGWTLTDGSPTTFWT